jgi:hypothetical protein
MLFGVVYTGRETVSEESEKRSLALFAAWQPPFEFKAHWARADGSGGIAVVESDSAATLLEGVAPWQPFFHFDISPVLGVEEAVPIFAKVNAWRDSVG